MYPEPNQKILRFPVEKILLGQVGVETIVTEAANFSNPTDVVLHSLEFS